MSRARAIEWLVCNVGCDIFDDDGDHVPAIKLAAHLTRLDTNEVARLLLVRLTVLDRQSRRETALEEAEEARTMDE